MVSYLRNNIGFVGNKGIIPKGLSGHSKNELNKYDPKKAKLLIDKFKNDNKIIPKITLTTDPNYLDICEFIQKELENIGLEIKIDVMPPSMLKQARSNGKLDMFRASWIADYPDAENYLSLFYSKNFSPQGPNYTHYNNLKFDELYEKSFYIKDAEQRSKIFNKMDIFIMESNPVVPLFYDEVIHFTQKNVYGLSVSPNNILKLKKVKKTKN